MLVGRLRSTSFRTFVVWPLVVLAWEFTIHEGHPRFDPWFAPLLAWGYLQYWLIGRYRLPRGGGGPGMDTPPEHLVTSGPYAWCRNPMYLGHIIFLVGLAATLRSELGTASAVASAVWFQFRVRRDERRLGERFGEAYLAYARRVKRWVPGVF